MIKNKEKEEKKLKKLDEGFFEQYTDDFADYFENQRVMRIMLGTEYKKINKAICEIKNKYPNVVALLEDGEKTKLNDEEENALKKIEAILISEKCRVDRIEEISVENEEEIIHEFLVEKEFDNTPFTIEDKKND